MALAWNDDEEWVTSHKKTHIAGTRWPIPSTALRHRIQVHQLEQMRHPNLCEACDSKGIWRIGTDSRKHWPQTWPLNLKRRSTRHVSPSSPLRLPERERERTTVANELPSLNCFKLFIERFTGRKSSRRGQSLSHLTKAQYQVACLHLGGHQERPQLCPQQVLYNESMVLN